MTISELIRTLADAQARFGDLEVRCMWESITPEIDGVYRGLSDGGGYCLLIDSDGCQDRAEYEHPDDRSPERNP